MRLLPEPGGRIVGGEIRFNGEDLLRMSTEDMRQVRGAQIAMILQDPMASLNPAFTVGVQIAEPLRLHRGLRGRSLQERVVELLQQVRISAPEQRVAAFPHQMSGGWHAPARGRGHCHFLSAEPATGRRTHHVTRCDHSSAVSTSA